MKLFADETFPVHIGFTCDDCGRTDIKGTMEGDMEFQEYLHYEDRCGYGAEVTHHYQDGDKISISLCQYCKHKHLGQLFRVEK